MARALNRLSARRVASVKDAGYYADGGGLYLQVSASGSKSWVFRYTRQNRTHDMGLGPLHTVGLAEARQQAINARGLLLQGIDPLAARRAARAALDDVPTFAAAATTYIEEHRKEWRSAKHAQQWENTLTTYASPVIGTKPVDQVDTDDMLAILRPIWATKTETASRVRQRVESVLDAEYARKHWDKLNPARWRGHLAKLLPKPSKVRKKRHFPALPYADLPDFMTELRKQKALSARALEWTILTVARTNMATGTRWDEIEGDAWTVPEQRMKTGEETHVVPLSGAALAILEALPKISPYVFPGGRSVRVPISNAAMDELLERMGYAHITVHGFRSTFKDWCADETGFEDDLSEAALAHVIPDKTKAAYRRGTAFKKRRKLMEAWAQYACPGHRPLHRHP